MNIEKKLLEKGIKLAEVKPPAYTYVSAKTVGNIVYVSGCDCRIDGKLLYEGKLGTQLSVAQGAEAARQCMINILSVLKAHLGDLDRIKQFVKILGFVNSAPGFVEQPYVMNGASDLLVEIFGEKGTHTRSAIAANELPFNTPVEVEAICEINE
jgi:enamine deaminase RidA (YjgF/YER057c/UK114 family)